MSNIPEFPYEQVRFEDFKGEGVNLYVQTLLSDYPTLAKHAKFQAHLSHSIQGLVMQITTWCLAGRIPSDEVIETVEWPDGVWQMFKSLHMPEWFLHKFPVRTKQVNVKKVVNHYFVCPHTLADPSWTHLKFMATGNPQAGRM